jgi:stage II sporulation protein AA (anti-sigma F factor antagonist)
MGVKVERKGNIAIARLNGVLNADTGDATADALAEFAFDGNARVLIDLTDLHYLDSSGISVLLRTVTRSRMNAGRVLFVNPSPFVREIFDVTQLNKFFEIFDNLAAAETALMKE